MNLKKFLALFLAITMVLSLVACGGKGNKNSSTETPDDQSSTFKTDTSEIPTGGEPDKDAYINSYMAMQPTTLDPAKCADAYGIGIIFDTLEPLIRIGDNKEGGSTFMPAAAEKWEVSKDQLTYTFHLRDGMTWTDGQPLTSKDFAYAIRRGADPATAAPYAQWFYYIKNGQQIVEGKEKPDKIGVATPDDKTLVITLDHPVPYFLSIVSQRSFFPQREDLVKKYGDKYATTVETSPACGPFILKNWVNNSSMTLEKNPKYWDAKNVKVDKLNIKIIQDENAIYNALDSGELDMASVSDPKRREAFKNDKRFFMVASESAGTSFLMCNNKKGHATANAKIRQAISACIDRQDYINSTMDGVPRPAYEFVPKNINIGDQVYNKGDGPIKALIAEVKDPKALFLEGMKEENLGDDPSKVTIHFLGSGDSPKVRLMSEFIQQALESKIGCKVNIENLDWNSFYKKATSGEFDLASLSYGAQYNDPSDFMNLWVSDQAIFQLDWKNEEYDKLVKSCDTEADQAKRAEAFHKAETILLKDQAIIIPLVHGVGYTFFRTYVRGVSVNNFNTRGDLDVWTSGREAK